MRLIDYIRSTGFEGFDEIPHLDLTDSSDFLWSLDAPKNVVVVPPFRVFTAEINDTDVRRFVYCHIRGKGEAEEFAQRVIPQLEGPKLIFEPFSLLSVSSYVYVHKLGGMALEGVSGVILFDKEYTGSHWAYVVTKDLEKKAKSQQKDFTWISGHVRTKGHPTEDSACSNWTNELVRLFSVLACNNAEMLAVEPTKIEKKKARRGRRPPPRTVSVLKLNGETPKVQYTGGAGADRRASRKHMVRSHVRRFSSPVKVSQTIVSAHLRGKGKLNNPVRKVIP